jgi:hypothetical protein
MVSISSMAADSRAAGVIQVFQFENGVQAGFRSTAESSAQRECEADQNQDRQQNQLNRHWNSPQPEPWATL